MISEEDRRRVIRVRIAKSTGQSIVRLRKRTEASYKSSDISKEYYDFIMCHIEKREEDKK